MTSLARPVGYPSFEAFKRLMDGWKDGRGLGGVVLGSSKLPLFNQKGICLYGI